MPISIKCQFCGKAMKVKDQLAGKKIKCTDCGSHVLVGSEDDDVEGGEYSLKPVRSRSPADDEDDHDDFEAAPRRRRSQSGNGAVMIGVLAGCGVLLLFCIVTPAFLLLRSTPQPNPDVAQNVPVAQRGGAPAQPFDANKFKPRFQPGQQPQQGGFQQQPADPVGFQPPAAQPQVAGNRNVPNVNPGGFNKPAGPEARGINWSAKADPPPQPLAPIALKKPLQLADSFEGPLFPINGGQFIATGGNGQPLEVREFYDLATGKRIGSLKGVQLDGAHRALSDDGQWFAGKLAGRNEFMVWDVKASKNLGTLKIPGTFVNWLGFSSAKRVMVLANKMLTCWKLPSGDFERTIAVDARDEKHLATSPGGTYLAVVDPTGANKSVSLIDLESGKNAGEIPIPGGYFDVRGVAFSPDGSELAALFTKGTDALLMAWQMADGQMSASIELDNQTDLFHKWHRYKGRQLVWFPDQKRWLAIGQVVISRDESAIVWSLPDASLGNDRYVQVLDDTHLAIATKSFGQSGKLASLELTKEKLAEASKVIAQGGAAVDVDLPAMTKSDSSSARQLIVGEDLGDWEVKPDPAPLSKGKLLTQPLVLKNRSAKLESGAVSSGASARFVAQYSQSNKAGSRRAAKGEPKEDGPQTPAWLDVYDLAGGKFSATTPVPFDATLTSVSPDGKRALLRLNDKKDRLDVIDVDGGKPICGWRPYQSEKDEHEREIKSALFIDNNHVLTLNGGFNGDVILWEIPSCKAIFTIEKAGHPGASPGGKYVVAANAEMYRFFDAVTGDPAGAVKLPGPVQAAAFHPNGESFGALINDNGSTTLLVWKLSDGSLEHEVPLGVFGTSMKFTSKLNVLVNNSDLIDIPSKCLVWKYQSLGAVPIGITPDARQWYLTGRPRGDGLALNAVTMPHDDAARAIALAHPKPDYVIAPGTAVTLTVNVAAPPAKPNFAAEVTEMFTKRLHQNGATIQAGSPVVIAVQSGNATNTTGNWEFTGFGPGSRGNESVPKQKIQYSVTITRGGTKVWSRSGEVDNGAFGFVRVSKDKTTAQYLSEMMWDRLTATVSGQGLPKYVMTDEAAKGLGTSWFTAQGIQRGPN